MPRAFLIKKHSPGKENTAKTKPDQFDPDGHDHMDTQADSDTLDVATPESSRGPFDLTTKASKAEDEPEPAKTTPCTPGVIEFSPKIVPTPDYNAQIIPSKPSVLVPSVTRPTPSHIQKPVPRIYSQPYMSPYGYSSLMHPPPYTFPYNVYKNGWLQPMEGVPCSTLYTSAGHWGPREATPSPDSRQSLLESAGGKPLVSSSSSSSHPPRYECQECSKSYATYSGLARHKQFHCLTQAKKSFTCKYCDKVYVSLGALKMHIRTHTLPCKCTLCGKAFSRPWLLQGHIRTHTGEKPFACPHCNRAFADRSNLRAHLQTHSEIKKYNCRSCSKTFSRMSLLSKHTDGGCNTIRYGPVAIQNC